MELLKIQDITFTYPDEKESAIGPLCFTVQQGDFIICCGKSGCGKTTLLKMLKKELTPYGKQSGTIYYKQQAYGEKTDVPKACEIGYVMQNPEQQLVTDKVWHEMAFGLEDMGIETSVMERRIAETANYFGIHSWFHKNTHELSGGQKQLLNLASIMVMRPKILLLDEPTSQLDPIAANEFIETVRKLNQDMGLTVIMSEHHLEKVFPFATKVMVLEKGKCIAWEKPVNILRVLEQQNKTEIIMGLPSATRIYHGTWQTGDNRIPCPLTVNEGKEYFHQFCVYNKLTRIENSFNQKIDKYRDTVLKKIYAIQLNHIWFRYEADQADVLQDISIKIYQNEIFAIVGGNGSGKSTLLNVIAGIRFAYHGKIQFWDDKSNTYINIKKYKKGLLYRQNLTLLPQNPQTVFVKQTIYDDYMELNKNSGLEKEKFLEKVKEITELLEINHLLYRHPYDLSGGEQQKAALGKILLLQPKILLLDEPTKGLDAYGKYELSQLFRKLRTKGLTILFVTHDIEFAAMVSDRCGLFFNQQIIAIEETCRFFAENEYYTTSASKIARSIFPYAITCEDVIQKMKGAQ